MEREHIWKLITMMTFVETTYAPKIQIAGFDQKKHCIKHSLPDKRLWNNHIMTQQKLPL